MTEVQKKRRLAWAKERLSWTQENWNRIIFSDESKFDVYVGDSRKRIIRSKGEAFHKECLKRTVKFAKGIMIWGCMSSKGLGTLEFINGTVNAEKYQQTLNDSLLPNIEKLHPDGNFIFQQDGASSHTAKSTKNWFAYHDTSVLDWPLSSPDLNIIETVWNKMKKCLRNNPQRKIPELRQKLQEMWNDFTPQE